MPGRELGKRAYSIVYGLLEDRDGDGCKICGKTPDDYKAIGSRWERLTIDHRDGDKTNYNPSNLQLLCRPCNSSKGGKDEIPADVDRGVDRTVKSTPRSTPRLATGQLGPKGDTIGVERERERESRGAVDYWGGSSEMKANELYRQRFTAWINNYLDDHSEITRIEAISSGAFISGANVQTVTRYLAPLVSIEGPLTQATNESGIQIIRRAQG